jgi:hypothetical protein
LSGRVIRNRETVRTQLKAVLSKTGLSRQQELVIFGRIDRAHVAVPHSEEKAVTADRCTELAKHGWPKGGMSPAS